MNVSHKKLAAGAVVLVAITWWLATSPQSPIRPEPPRNRPVLKFLARVVGFAARFGLTALYFVEPAPTDADETQLARAAVGVDGHQLLTNARW